MSSNLEIATDSVGFDSEYEITRVSDQRKFNRKLLIKRWLHRIVGEIYIGKRVKLVYFRNWLSRITLPPSPVLLEVGSGDGLFCFTAAESMPEASVAGLELNPVEASACQQIALREAKRNLSFVAGLLQDHDWKEKYDLIFCLDVLEHIKDDLGALSEMHSALKAGGSLLIHVPNRFYREVDGSIHTISDEEAWRVNPGHVRNGYTPVELTTLLHRANFSIKLVELTQGPPIARAHRLYRRIERLLPLRIALLPIIDYLIKKDRRGSRSEGNTVWAWATKPAESTANVEI